MLTGRLEAGEVLEVEWRPDAGRLVRIEGSRAADRSRVKLSLLDLPLLPQELLELVPESLRRRRGDAGVRLRVTVRAGGTGRRPAPAGGPPSSP